jgi:hypothetical protein
MQDAIKITRGLGIKYLWVDALCILQDEVSDKSHEIERMGEIFRNATVTIAAANSPGATDGFLKAINPPPSIQSSILGRGREEPGKIWLVPQVDHDHKQEPLAKRGWAFQEQILSPRLLHYGSKGVTWTCQSERSRHVLPHFVNYAFSGARLPQYIRERMYATPDSSQSLGSVNSNRIKITHYWPDTVEDYCSRNLTFAQDKLLAIAGVAAEFHKLYPDIYLAGIWKQDSIRQLGWRRKLGSLPEGHIHSIGRCEAPSWSWASMDGPIDFGPIFSPDADFVKSFVRPRISTSPFGDVAGAKLVLSEKILQIPGFRLKIILDRNSSPDSPLHKSVSKLESKLMDRSSDEKSLPVWYMLLGYSSHKAPMGLVLLKKVDMTFERIGYFESPNLVDPCVELNEELRSTEKRMVEIT